MKESKVKSVKEVAEFSKLSHFDMQMFLDMGVNRAVLKKFFSARFCKDKSTLTGYAIGNVFNGYECFTLPPSTSSFTSGHSGHIEILGEGCQGEVCCVFYSIMDYLAYAYLRSVGPLPLIDKADCFIMCHPNNFFSLAVNTDGYKKILLFLPKSEYGQTISLTLAARNPGHVRDCSFYYGIYGTLSELCNEWIKKEDI